MVDCPYMDATPQRPACSRHWNAVERHYRLTQQWRLQAYEQRRASGRMALALVTAAAVWGMLWLSTAGIW